ncbi:MAG: transcription elongation factor GreA [Planctomycetaceae bacterium]|nr:transcription elongation factor GreA [Planctomycetaceae bacterium]
MERQPISREGYDKIRAEIEALEATKPDVLERIKTAREEGDLKENAEYHAAREALAHLERQIGTKRLQLSKCEIVKKSDGPSDTVAFGTRVTIKDLSDDMEEAYELVGPGEEDYSGEVMKILTSSPIAQAMLGKKVGDQVEVEIPAGKLNLEILAIE